VTSPPSLEGKGKYNRTTGQRSKRMTAQRRLMSEYKALLKDGPHGISAGPLDEHNFLEWEFLLEGPQDTPFEGGLLPGALKFPASYPHQPPVMKLTCAKFHPNVYKDKTGYESVEERWSPIQSVEKILLSVLSMLAEPNDESGANIDACKVWRSDRKEYERIVRRQVRETLGL